MSLGAPHDHDCTCARCESRRMPAVICQGMKVTVRFHTGDAYGKIVNPESLRFAVGKAVDSLGLQEEVDYTLEVTRFYE